MKNRMMRNSCLFLLLLIAVLPAASEMENIQMGGGRDTLKYFLENDSQKIGVAFNILLQEDGQLAVEKAEKFLSEDSDPIVKSYLCVMLADYHSIRNNSNESIRYLKRAVTEYNQIRADNYYFLVFSRIQKNVQPSPGKDVKTRKNILSKYFPFFVSRKSPIIPDYIEPQITSDTLKSEQSTETDVAEKKPIPKKTVSPDIKNSVQPAKQIAQDRPPLEIKPAYRIQLGAFSRRENAETLAEQYEKRGYSVIVVENQRESSSLYIVRVGSYGSYNEAKQAYENMKQRYPSVDGYVTKVSP